MILVSGWLLTACSFGFKASGWDLWWKCSRCRDPRGKSFPLRIFLTQGLLCLCVQGVPGRYFLQLLTWGRHRTFLWWIIWFFADRFSICKLVCRVELLGSRPWWGCSCWRYLWWWPVGELIRRHLSSCLPKWHCRSWGLSGGILGSSLSWTSRRFAWLLAWQSGFGRPVRCSSNKDRGPTSSDIRYRCRNTWGVTHSKSVLILITFGLHSHLHLHRAQLSVFRSCLINEYNEGKKVINQV